MLGGIVELFFSKIGEQLVDHVQNIVRSRETLDSLRRNLESLSARASDVEEQIKNAELSGKKKRKREVENWLTEVRSIETDLENEEVSDGFISRFLDGGQAAKLNERVDKLVEQSRHFGELLLDVHETRGEALLTTGLVGKAFEENLERIWRLLVTDKVSSIGIYGMGGVGKTTLAKHINNRFMENTQECVFWVTVSEVFTIKMLQDEIAHVVGVNLSDEKNEDKRAARLHRALSQRKNSILILDDVWKNIDLKKVGDPLSVDGCRLMITTRSLGVCRQIGCREVIRVEKLHRDEAWNLFTKTLGQDMTLAPQVQEIAKSMTKLCDGLPLGIITLAGSMKGETAIHVWRNALEELKESVMRHDDMEDRVFKVLKYSFDRLNPDDKRSGPCLNGYSSLQLCFLYCSLYPEDYQIPKGELVRKFISEELMDKRRSRKAQVDQGHSIVDKLVNVCLLESLPYGCVKMHDLVRAMALKITEGKTMVIAGHFSGKEIPNEEEWTKDLEKVSLMHNSIREIPPGMSPNCPKLSTLLLQGNSFLRFLTDAFFSQMHGLCTLDLSRTHIRELPNSLSDLESLKALLLEDCQHLEYVPYLGRLKALRELDLSGTAIKEVPQGIEELVNLKFLSIDTYSLETFPTGLLLKFPNLQYLRFPNYIEVSIEEIERLKRLEGFSGRVNNVCDFNRFISSRQCQEYDTFYNIQIGSSPYRDDFRGYDFRFLTMGRYNFSKEEEKDETMLAQDIHHLKFLECKGLSNCLLDDFTRLKINPICLRSLTIADCEGIECILKSEQLMMAPAEELESQFSTLEEIVLLDLSDFKGVIHRGEIGATILASPHPSRQAVFSSLRLLGIFDCRKMKKLGLPVSEFPNLEEIEVDDCPEIEEIIQVEADDEEEGRSSGEGQEARRRFVTLPKLKRLELYYLPRLERICKATMICSSIETISLAGCPTLKKLPFNAPPPTLKQISLHNMDEEKEWWESLEWEHPTHSHLFQPLARFGYRF